MTEHEALNSEIDQMNARAGLKADGSTVRLPANRIEGTRDWLAAFLLISTTTGAET